MEFKILPIIAFLSVAIVVSHAALPSEEYWNSVLPNTPMPKAVKDLLQPTPEWLEDKSGANVNVGGGKGGGGVNVNTPSGTNVNVGGGKGGGGVNVNTPSGTHVGVGGGPGGGGVNVNTPSGTHVGVGGGPGGGGVTVGSHNRRGRPVYVRVAPGSNPFQYRYAASATQLHDDPNAALFFLERDLFAGNKMNLRFSQSTKNQQTFLPRQLADSIPFSSEKLPAIFSELDVEPASAEAAAIRKTIQECEGGAAVKGEEKFCATSLESMIDFSTAVLGKEVSAVSTAADGGGGEAKAYRVAAVKRLTAAEAAAVVCHQQEYSYAVFYCHKTDATVAYGVSLVGGGGAKAEAVAVCHRDTSEWNPKHLAFQVLKVKPGTVPICHYLPENHIVWVSKN